MSHPWLLVEDSHVNMLGVFEYFDNFMEPGDYICVEDTNPKIAAKCGQGLLKEMGYDQYGSVKLMCLDKFMKNRSHRYVVDQRYTDFFGWVFVFAVSVSKHRRVTVSGFSSLIYLMKTRKTKAFIFM